MPTDANHLELSDILRAVCDASPDGVYLHKDGRVLHANLAAEQTLGYGSGELVGLDVHELTSPRSVDGVRRSISTQNTEVTEIWGLRRDGSEVRLEIRPRNVLIGQVTYRAAVVRNLSKRDADERERQAFVALLRATFDSTADGMLAIGPDGRIALHNERFRELWSVPGTMMRLGNDAEILSFCADQLVDREQFMRNIGQLRAQPMEAAAHVLELRDGRVIERHSRPQHIGDEVVGRVVSFRDVTTQRAAERASQLAVQMRDEFLAIASHELLTPVSSLNVAMRGLRGTAAITPEVGERLWENATRQLERLTRLIQELLDVARIDGARLELARADVELGELAREVLDRFSLVLERANIAATLEAPTPVRGSWDRSRLEQVLSNLLANAIKFGQGRPIEVRVRAVEDVGAELSVRDHGIGVPHEQQALIFERFQRAVSSRHYAGLGLGLYITRQLVEAHGGRLALSSPPGEGAMFTVQLPFE
jgi:PAS domain S-box-containing protein